MANWRTLTFGPTLYRYRTEARFSQTELADCLEGTGFAPSTASHHSPQADLPSDIERIESGDTWPFADSDLEPFLESCAHCLFPNDPTVRIDLAASLADDILDESS